MPHTQAHRVHYTFNQMPHTHTHTLTLVTNEGSPLQNTHITYPITGSHENTHTLSPSPINVCPPTPHTHTDLLLCVNTHTSVSSLQWGLLRRSERCHMRTLTGTHKHTHTHTHTHTHIYTHT